MTIIVLAGLGMAIVLYARNLRRAQAGAGGGTLVGGIPERSAVPIAAPDAGAVSEQGHRLGHFGIFLAAFRRQRVPFAAACVLAGITAACIVLPFVLPWTATEIDMKVLKATPPSLAHPLGTDAIGRDQLARLLAAGRISILIGLMVAIFSVAIGALVGTVAGFFGGRADMLIMWLVDVMLAIPPLPLLIALSVLVSSQHSPIGAFVAGFPEQWRIVFVMSAFGWMSISRVVRAQVLSLRNQEYVESARALGGSSWRLMLLHIMPNCAPTMVVFGTFAVSGAIMGESFLSFLGVGVNPPTPTWGNMISESSDLFTVMRNWWLVWTPAVAIVVTVLCTSFVGDGLRDTLDPQSGSSD